LSLSLKDIFQMKNTGDKLKVVGVLTHYKSSDGKARLAAVDWWRIKNPLTQLLKNGHEVTFVNKLVEGYEEGLSFEEAGKDFDIIYTSYLDDPKTYSYIRATCEAYGCRHIMDIDDNLLDIDEMNPARLRYHLESKPFKVAMKIIADVDILTVSTEHLKETYQMVRPNKPIVVLPNYIDPETYKYNEKKVPDNKEKIVIGYQGSATHFADIFKTPFIWALRKILLKYPNVYFACIGSFFEDFYRYLPKDKLMPLSGARHFPKWVKIWQSIPFDIGVAPLYPSAFNRSKSSIKYYEYSLRKIPGVYAFWEPYLKVVKEGRTGFFAREEEEWFAKLCWLIEDKKTRLRVANQAREHVLKNYTIQKHWKKWEKLFKEAKK